MTLNVALVNEKDSLALMYVYALHLYMKIFKIVDDIFSLKIMYLMIIFDKMMFICKSEVMIMFTCFLNFFKEMLRKYFHVFIVLP